MRKNITARDVAELAGVSKWMVIRAFREGASISQEAREKVLKAAQELSYQPNLLARSLATRKTHQIGVLVDDFSNPFKWSFLEQFTAKAQERQLSTVLININASFNQMHAILNASQRQMDAVVLFDTAIRDNEIKMLGAGTLPPLYLMARTGDIDDSASVSCDAELAVEEMVSFLFLKGYRRPAYLAGTRTLSAELDRQRSFEGAWMKRGVSVCAHVFAGRYSADAGYQAFLRYFSEVDPLQRPDVLMCENDILAVGAMDAARSFFGLSIPHDLAFVGFDNIEPAGSPSYKLTTYEQPRNQMIDILLDMISGKYPVASLALPGRLIVRESA